MSTDTTEEDEHGKSCKCMQARRLPMFTMFLA